MVGRYGFDHLSIALLILSFVLSYAVRPFNATYLWLIVYLPMGLYIYRVLSRDILRRQQENYKFLKIWRPILTFFMRGYRRVIGNRQYRYYSCPNCKGELRVPRGKGRIKITCPRCHQAFIKKT